jgi:hypothetical protein
MAMRTVIRIHRRAAPPGIISEQLKRPGTTKSATSRESPRARNRASSLPIFFLPPSALQDFQNVQGRLDAVQGRLVGGFHRVDVKAAGKSRQGAASGLLR